MPEILLSEILIYLITGAFVGFAAGLLGIGGGLIIVPVLTLVFSFHLVETQPIVHLAIGTSLATILITSLSSVRAHHALNNVRWDIMKLLFIGVLLGAFLGGWGSQFFDSRTLGILFGVLELFIAINMLLALKPSPHRALPGLPENTLAGIIIGSLSSLVGIGGGTLTTPYLVWNNVSMRQAIATSAAVSLPVALAGTIGFLMAGMNANNLPDYATGYIYWPAFFGIVFSSVLTAPLGAKCVSKVSIKLLKRFFGGILLILAAKMLIFS